MRGVDSNHRPTRYERVALDRCATSQETGNKKADTWSAFVMHARKKQRCARFTLQTFWRLLLLCIVFYFTRTKREQAGDQLVFPSRYHAPRFNAEHTGKRNGQRSV
jgi:hypothetical protein